jgi:putative phosphoesterase
VRIGVTSDIHSRVEDGSDVPATLFARFEGVDRIVACGDHTTAAALRRLREIAPLTATINPRIDDDGGDEAGDVTTVFEAGGVRFGVLFSPEQLGGKVNDVGDVTWPEQPLADAIRETFGEPIDVLLLGGTHVPMVGYTNGVLVVNPGSSRFAARPTAAVVTIDEAAALAEVSIVDV